MNTRTLILGLALSSLPLALSATVADRISVIEADIITLQDGIDDLANWFGEDLVDHADELETFEMAIAADIQDVIDNGDEGAATLDELDTLNADMVSVEALRVIIDDYQTVGSYHKDCADTLMTIGLFDLNNDAADNQAIISDARADIEDILAEVEALQTLGLGGVGGIQSAEPWGKFLEEVTAISAINDMLADFDDSLYPGYQALLDAINAEPAEDDDDIANYDTALNAAQSDIEDAADTIATLAATTDGLAGDLIALDRGTTEYTDFITDAAYMVKDRIGLIAAEAIRQKGEAAVTRAGVAVRIVQRQLLFDSATAAQKNAAKTLLATKLLALSSSEDDLESFFEDLSELLEVEPIEFSDIEIPEVAGRSGMGQLVDANVEKYKLTLNKQVRKLNRKGANQSLIDNVIANLEPAIYLQQTAQVMLEWNKDRAKRIGKLSGGAFDDALTLYTSEWNDLKAEMAANKSEADISTTAQTAVNTEIAKSAYTALFTGVTSGKQFKKNVSAISKTPVGPIYRLKVAGVAEFKRALTGLLPSIKAGSVTDAPTRRTNANNTAPETVSLPDTPDVTIDAVISLTQTLDDGSTLLVTGSGDLAARLVDPIFADAVTDKLDASLQIFMNSSARIGLGTANISSSPGQTPNVLGGASEDADNTIQIIPDGNGFIDVNSDLFIGGGKPLVPTPSFGLGEEHRITFYAPPTSKGEASRTITVLANTTWDLSDFGNDSDEYPNYSKQIVFSGVKVVLQPGAKIRFPVMEPNKEKKGPVLYFNEGSQLVCEGDPTIVGNPWTDEKTTGSDCKRNKILGCGQIWLNKDAKLIINKPAMLGIEADYTTPRTNMVFSLQRNAQFLIGTNVTQGGSFQVGNMFYGGSKYRPHSEDPDDTFPNSSVNTTDDFVPHVTTIDFKLILNGSGTRCQIGRSGFFGCAAGIINKDGAPNSVSAGPNGVEDVEGSAWQLQRLYNVTSITFDITQGFFDHNIIVDGTNSDCSMLAIGSLANHFPGSKYLFRLGDKNQAFVRGGGNLYYVDKDASLPVDAEGFATIDNIHTVSITDEAAAMSFSSTNTGKCRILAPTPALRTRSDLPYRTVSKNKRTSDEKEVAATIGYAIYGRGFVQSDSANYAFAGPNEEFFECLGLATTTDTAAALALVGSAYIAGSVANNTITRAVVGTNQVKNGTPAQGVGLGYLIPIKTKDGIPSEFKLPF